MKILTIIKSLIIIYCLLGMVMFLFQRSLIYHPSGEIDHNHKTLEINNNGFSIQSLLTHENNSHAIIYFGGNAENVAYTATDFQHQFPNHSTYLMKYRGYSGAQGQASEANLLADALKLFDTVKAQHTDVFVIGRSLGSGIASYVANQRPINKLVLVTPFDSLRSVAQSLLPIYPMGWLLQDQYDNVSRVQGIKTEILIVAAVHDQVIPASHTDSLAEAIPQHLLKTTTLNSGHNDLDLNPDYFPSLRHFLNAE